MALAAIRGGELPAEEKLDESTGEVRQVARPQQQPAFIMIGEPKDLAQLFKKMSQVLAEVGRVAKLGENKEQGYPFMREADLLDEVRPLLGKHGIAFFPTVVDSRQRTGRTARSGAQETITKVCLQTAFCCTDTGAMLISTWHGEASDFGDKSYWKAYTGTLKYAHFKTWMVSSGDDPENDDPNAPREFQQEEPRRPQPRQRTEKQAPKQSSTKSHVPPEQTEYHVELLRAIHRRNEALPHGFASTVGNTKTEDLKAFIRENWELIASDIRLARKAAEALDAADKELTQQRRAERKQKNAEKPAAELNTLRKKYFATLNEKLPDFKDNDRHDFQRDVVGKESTEDWDAEDYRKAIAAVEAGEAERYAIPF